MFWYIFTFFMLTIWKLLLPKFQEGKRQSTSQIYVINFSIP